MCSGSLDTTNGTRLTNRLINTLNDGKYEEFFQFILDGRLGGLKHRFV